MTVLLGVSLGSSASNKVIVLASGEWPPFLSQQQPHGGFAAHVVDVTFKSIGYDVLYQYYPWARAEHMVQYDQIQGSLVWSKTAKREAFALFSVPVIRLQSVIFHLKSKPLQWQTLNDLKQKTLCLPLGSADDFYQPLIKAKKLKLARPGDIAAGFRLLLKQRCDFMSLGKEVGYYTLRTEFNAQQRHLITHHPTPVKELSYSLMLSKKQKANKTLIAEFNEQLLWLRQSGQIQKMQRDFADGKYDVKIPSTATDRSKRPVDVPVSTDDNP